MTFADTAQLVIGINDAIKGTDLFLSNKLKETESIFLTKNNSNISSYHCCGRALYNTLQAVVSYAPEKVTTAIEEVDDCLRICYKFRKKNDVIQAFNKLVSKDNYNGYNPKEIHAELCYAEILLVRGLLSFIEDESMMGFISGAVKIRNCVNMYNDCYVILEKRNWENDLSKVHFESGVLFGIGSFNLLISLMPRKVIKILQFIGFSGNLEKGLDYLIKTLSLDSARKILGELMLLVYNMHILTSISDEEGDLDLSAKIIDSNLKKYPHSFLFLYFHGRLELCRGNFTKSKELYTMSWKSQDEWLDFHNIIFWELFWVECFLMDWDQAEIYMNYLIEKSNWSPCLYTFGKASLLCMKEHLTEEDLSTLETLMKIIPGLKSLRKSLAAEKFAIKQTERFFIQNQLVLPIFQLMYLWNKFTLLRKNLKVNKKVLQIIQQWYDKIEHSNSNNVDDKCLLLLLKGSCLRQMENYEEAISCLEQAISYEANIVSENHLIPYAKVELAFLYINRNDHISARNLLQNAETYKNYSLENRLHFKIHTALTKLDRVKSSFSLKNTKLTFSSSTFKTKTDSSQIESNTPTTSKNSSLTSNIKLTSVSSFENNQKRLSSNLEVKKKERRCKLRFKRRKSSNTNQNP